ncbi:hypothetical protein [Paenibacillus ehimensis]|uniref:Uncharacterized protein n=1 Tax=Paenibacillus ehimensis TaxID=79264 RepID=A0ABT8VFR3_9BACL|nr:hypothetical protein [Paenibacillus ehimensis]MDO3679817.1 hypothetical protein [Paenibacillus ehimensis]HWO95140.1 hypothetical protein [Bacillus sp. (in: firmicutes)]
MNKRWISNPKPAKLSASDKSRLESVVSQFISGSSRLSEIVYRVDIKAGRIYLYRLHEQFGWDKPDVQFIKPLIDGKYAEFPMARITLYDAAGDKCEADWQRHTGRWINLFTGNITESLSFIEENEQWYQ